MHSKLQIAALLSLLSFQTYANTLSAEKLKQERIYLELGESLYAEKQYSSALSVLRDFIEVYPDSAYLVKALEKMALIYEKSQRYEKALASYKKLYQETGVTSGGLKYYFSQARLLSNMGEIDEAEKIYHDIIRISPDSPYAGKARINLQLSGVFQEQSQEDPNL